MANPFERCPSVLTAQRPNVRCDRWDGHAGRHRGFDDHDNAQEWDTDWVYDPDPHESHVHVPWNQPVPDNLEVEAFASGKIQELEKQLAAARDERDQYQRQAERAREYAETISERLAVADEIVRRFKATLADA